MSKYTEFYKSAIREALSPEEQSAVQAESQRWMPRFFVSDEDPATHLVQNPVARAIPGGLVGAGIGSSAGALLGSSVGYMLDGGHGGATMGGAVLGGAGGALLGGTVGALLLKKLSEMENRNLIATMKRQRKNPNVGDIAMDPLTKHRNQMNMMSGIAAAAAMR